MIDQNITDKLTNAARDWATAAGREFCANLSSAGPRGLS